MDIRQSYDSAAQAYADHLSDELLHKPLDRHLLNRFAEATRGQGLVADLGCGPGHITRYLRQQGVTVCGVDLSENMVAVARTRNPEIEFRNEDMRSLSAQAGSLTGIVLFYSIVHFAPDELLPVFVEARRVLVPNGCVLIAFHVGEYTLHRDELFGVPVSLEFQAHLRENVVDALHRAGFEVTEESVREPYEEVEHPSRRCYLLARAV